MHNLFKIKPYLLHCWVMGGGVLLSHSINLTVFAITFFSSLIKNLIYKMFTSILLVCHHRFFLILNDWVKVESNLNLTAVYLVIALTWSLSCSQDSDSDSPVDGAPTSTEVVVRTVNGETDSTDVKSWKKNPQHFYKPKCMHISTALPSISSGVQNIFLLNFSLSRNFMWCFVWYVGCDCFSYPVWNHLHRLTVDLL